MTCNRLLLFLAVLLVASAPGSSASAQWLASDSLVISNLGDLIEVVRTANPSIEAASLSARALAQRPSQVGALPDPTFGLSVQPVPILTARGSQRSQWQIQQAIPFPGKLSLQASAAEWASRAAESDVESLTQNLVERTKHAYIDLYRILKQEALVRGFQRSLRGFEEVAQTLYQVGSGGQQSILKAQLERNTLSNRLLELAKAKYGLLQRLSSLTNHPVVLRDTMIAPPIPTGEPPAVAVLYDAAEIHRPELTTLAAHERRAGAMIELAHKEWLPDFGVGVTYFDIADTDMPPTADGRNAIALGVSARIPLQRGRLRGRLEETRLLAREIDARREALETAIQTEIDDLVYRIGRERDQILLFGDALIPQANTTLQATLSAYSTGRVGFLDLLDAERMLFNLQWSYEDTIASEARAQASLERAVGVDHLIEAGR